MYAGNSSAALYAVSRARYDVIGNVYASSTYVAINAAYSTYPSTITGNIYASTPYYAVSSLTPIILSGSLISSGGVFPLLYVSQMLVADGGSLTMVLQNESLDDVNIFSGFNP